MPVAWVRLQIVTGNQVMEPSNASNDRNEFY